MATAGAGLLLLLAGAAKSATVAVSPDAGLIRLCTAFHEADCASHAADDASWQAHLDRRWELSDAIEGMIPTTEAGRRAKVGVALVLMEELADTENAGERFALVTLRELAAGGAS